MGIGENLRVESSTPPLLSGLQVWVLQAVVNQLSVKEIADRLSKYGEKDYSEDTVRNVIKGLCGEKKRVPKKYHSEVSYLREVEFHPDNAVNYDVTQEGRSLLASIDTIPNLRVLTGGGNSLSDSLDDLGIELTEEKQGGVRPHKCWWREQIKRKPGEASEGQLSWSDRRAILMEKEIPFDEVEKELPTREQSAVGELVHYKGYNVILFENTALVQYDMATSSKSIFEVLDDWWSTRNEIVDWIQRVFPVLIRSEPVDVTMPLSTQEWGDVRNSFAEWIAENPELQDDSPNCLFEVKDDNDTRIFHVDTSPEDERGNPIPEGEFTHSQFGAEHIVNMKQAVKWMATLGVKPQDFQAAMWVRSQKDELLKVLELDAEELEARVSDLERDLTMLDGRVEGNTRTLQRHEDRIGEQDEKIGDVVERVDATRREIRSVEDELESEVETVQDSLVANDQAILEAVNSNTETNEVQKQRIQWLENQYREAQATREQMLEEQRRMRKLMERTIWDKARNTVESAASMVKSVVKGFLG